MNAHVSPPAAPAYAEFAVQSNFSFLRGASSPEELTVAAKLLGLSAIGLADQNTVAGVVRAWKQAEVAKLAYHPGCRLVFSDGTPDILAYPRDRQGWGHLCRMLTKANLRGEKGAPDLRLEDVLEWGDGMALAVLPDLSAPSEPLLSFLRDLRLRFGRAVRIAVSADYGGDDRLRIEQARQLAQASGLPLMAVNNVLYHAAERRPLQDVVTAIRLKTTVAAAGLELEKNGERHLKPPREMARLFRRCPDALAETLRFSSELTFSLAELQYNYPDEPTESGLPPQEELERLTWEGSRFRYPEGLPERVRKIIVHELETVRDLNYARYFLTVHDIVQYARSQGILCQGRGSAANSVICYCLGITDVGPDIIDTLFERFISKERNEPPDIDVDFEHEKRDEVIAYIYEKYSDKRTALAASVVTYRGRSALREVAKAIGLSEDVMAALSGSIWGWSSSQLGDRETKAAGLDKADPLDPSCHRPRQRNHGLPASPLPACRRFRHHARSARRDRADRQDGDGRAQDGRVGQGRSRRGEDTQGRHSGARHAVLPEPRLRSAGSALSARSADACYHPARKTARLRHDLPRRHARRLPDRKPCADDRCCRGCGRANSTISSSRWRSCGPGPIQGDMVHPYLRRRQGKEQVSYPKPELEAILGRTLGVPLFQEQAMKIAIVAGGFEPGEADQLRRAMATFKRIGTIGNYRQRMIEGMVARGYERDFAERCFKQIEGLRRVRLSRKPRGLPSRCSSTPPAGSRLTIPTSSARPC